MGRYQEQSKTWTGGEGRGETEEDGTRLRALASHSTLTTEGSSSDWPVAVELIVREDRWNYVVLTTAQQDTESGQEDSPLTALLRNRGLPRCPATGI